MQLMQQSQKLQKQAAEVYRTNQPLAVQYLQQKAAIDGQITLYNGQISNLEHHGRTVDNAAINVQMAHAMRTGNDEVRNLMQQVQIEDVADIADEADELSSLTHELGSALSRPISTAYAPFDADDSIQRQLQEWKDLEDISSTLPSIPKGEQPSKFVEPKIQNEHRESGL